MRRARLKSSGRRTARLPSGCERRAKTLDVPPTPAIIRRVRRYVFVILFFVVLVTPFLLRAMYGKNAESTPAGDAPTLIIVTPHVEGIRREFANAFSQWHQQHFGQAVLIDWRNFG